MDSIKINKLEIENVKRIKAVKVEPSRNGLTIVGGNILLHTVDPV